MKQKLLLKARASFRYFMDEIVGTENHVIAYFWAGAVALILVLTVFLGSSNMSFQGVAGSRELNINFEYPVEIKRVNVIQGQRVKKGDLLLELNQSELNAQIRQQQSALAKLKAERSVRDQLNRAVGNTVSDGESDPLLTEIRDLEEELSYLERQRKNLYVFSETDGIVGSVNFRRGEKAPSFTALVTLSSESPTFVQGFIHEKMHSQVQVGSKVTVSSLTNAAYGITGKVISIGSRMVEIPLRLGNPAALPVWGREVIVQIPKDSSLILGERVQISPAFSLFPSLLAQADEPRADENTAEEAKLIDVPQAISDRTNFEPSGAVYLPDLRKYLIASDDTDNNNTPFLFLMSEEGEVDEQLLPLNGMKEMIDMESISADGDYLYVMSSLSRRKNGPLKKERNLIVRMQRSGLELRNVRSIDIGAVVRKLILSSSDPQLKRLRNQGLEDFQVEGQTVRDNALYLTVKSPLLEDGQTLVLRLPGLTNLFDGGPAPTQLEVWKELTFELKGQVHQTSDLVFRGKEVYFLTTCRHADCSALWRLDGEGKEPKLLRSFAGLSAEGLAFNEIAGQAMVTFDQGENPAKFVTIPVSRLRER